MEVILSISLVRIVGFGKKLGYSKREPFTIASTHMHVCTRSTKSSLARSFAGAPQGPRGSTAKCTKLYHSQWGSQIAVLDNAPPVLAYYVPNKYSYCLIFFVPCVNIPWGRVGSRFFGILILVSMLLSAVYRDVWLSKLFLSLPETENKHEGLLVLCWCWPRACRRLLEDS